MPVVQASCLHASRTKSVPFSLQKLHVVAFRSAKVIVALRCAKAVPCPINSVQKLHVMLIGPLSSRPDFPLLQLSCKSCTSFFLETDQIQIPCKNCTKRKPFTHLLCVFSAPLRLCVRNPVQKLHIVRCSSTFRALAIPRSFSDNVHAATD